MYVRLIAAVGVLVLWVLYVVAYRRVRTMIKWNRQKEQMSRTNL